MLTLNLAFAGLAVGAIASMSGIGLLITYRTTGVFNLAHGAVAMFVAYLVYQAVDVWRWPIWIAAPVMILLAGPALGIGMDMAVFRRLTRRAASPAESLVASLGVLAFLLGVASIVWGEQTEQAPALFPLTTWQVGGLIIHVDSLIDLGIVLVATVSLAVLMTHTRFGAQVRAVVDRRDLAELSAINADRVSAIGWALGAGFAGLTGALLAPILGLNLYTLTLVVLEIFAVPVIARLSSLPVAIAAGLAIGLASSELQQVNVSGTAQTFFNALVANLFVVALLVALLAIKRLQEVGSVDAGSTSTLASRRGTHSGRRRREIEYFLMTVALLAPLAFPSGTLRQAQEVPALAVVFLSIVAVTGYSGQISLGQAGYAGLGALFFAKFSANAPELVALLWGIVAAGLVGLLTGYPAIRRRGLFLALTTFAVGAVVDRFVFNQPYFTNNVLVRRPNLLGLHLSGDRAFYAFELVCLGAALLVVRNLRSGRLGRALVAMRDSEEGARSVGVNLRVLKIFIFTTSAVLAGLGGALMVQTQGAFDPTQFHPLEGLLWFLAVVVFGADSAAGAVLAAGVAVLVNVATGNPDAYAVPIGILALALADIPGGVSEGIRRLTSGLAIPDSLKQRFADALPAPSPPRQLSARGRAIVAKARR
ncbi:MAG: ABC transporter permease [Mycobacteriales bacterium]